MKFSIFEDDGTLGVVGYETARFAGEFTSWGGPLSAVRDRIENNGWGVEAWSAIPAGGFTNVVNYTVSIRAECGMNKAVIAEGVKQSIEDSGAVRVTCRFLASNGCPRPDLVGSGTVFQTPPVPTVNAGALATVNVPISFDDDKTVQQGVGFLDTLKGFDTTTLVLLGLAAVLVLKKL